MKTQTNPVEKKICYIKPTRFKHDSGYRCFECGYILEMTDKNTVKRKQVLSTGSDHIYQDYMSLIENKPKYCLNMDLTMDGYIRLWSHHGKVVWESDKYLLSSAELNFIPKEK